MATGREDAKATAGFNRLTEGKGSATVGEGQG